MLVKDLIKKLEKMPQDAIVLNPSWSYLENAREPYMCHVEKLHSGKHKGKYDKIFPGLHGEYLRQTDIKAVII